MSDRNGDTVDTFPPFSTLEEDEADTARDYIIDDYGNDSPRVVGKVTDRTETASESLAYGEGNDTSESLESGYEGDSERFGATSLLVIGGVIAIAGIGAAGFFIMKKKK